MKTKRVLMTLTLCLVLGACSKGKKTAGKSYKIGVNQLMEHKALDDVREGFQEELKNLGVSFELDYKNAQGDVSSNSNIIESKFAQDKVDLILAISTPSAQSTLSCKGFERKRLLDKKLRLPISYGYGGKPYSVRNH